MGKRRHGVGLWLLGVALALVLVACGGRPHIEVGETTFDFGDVVNGEIVTRDIVVRNTGSADLVIEEVSTSCGCTQAEVEPTRIPPGGEGVLHIAFDSGAHGPQLTGQLMRQVFIVSNDPEAPEVVVEFTAHVLPPQP